MEFNKQVELGWLRNGQRFSFHQGKSTQLYIIRSKGESGSWVGIAGQITGDRQFLDADQKVYIHGPKNEYSKWDYNYAISPFELEESDVFSTSQSKSEDNIGRYILYRKYKTCVNCGDLSGDGPTKQFSILETFYVDKPTFLIRNGCELEKKKSLKDIYLKFKRLFIKT